MRLEFHPAAAVEFARAFAWYDLIAPSLGDKFAREVQRTAALVLAHPKIGLEVGKGRRRFPIFRLPFTLIYALADETVFVLAIAHDKRKPGYWQTRTA